MLTIEVSTLSSAFTRLPGSSSFLPVRPEMGARMWVNSRSSLARSTAARRARSVPLVAASSLVVRSKPSWLTTPSASSLRARSRSACSCASLASVPATLPSAWCSTAWYGRGSISYRSSPAATSVPSLNSTLSR